MSLADELLADLEEDNDEELEEVLKKEENDQEIVEMEVDPTDVNVNVDNVRSICKLRDSDKLKNILKQIDVYSQKPRKTSEMIGNVDSDLEYQLILDANSLSLEIDNEICKYKSFNWYPPSSLKLP
jgi:U4/U6 small nuclear ribonucleoprotein PRP31